MASSKTDDAKEALSSSMARQQVMLDGSNKVTEVNNADIYRVPAGWECEQLRADSALTHVTSAVALEAALQDAACETVFVPKQSALTLEMAKTIVERNGFHKTIFWEA